MTAETPDPQESDTPRHAQSPRVSGPWPLAGGLLTLVQALALLGFALFYLVELSQGQGDTPTVILSTALIVVMAVLLLVLARFWFTRSPRACTPTLAWNLVLVPVVITLYSAGTTTVATAALVLVAGSLVVAVAAMAAARQG